MRRRPSFGIRGLPSLVLLTGFIVYAIIETI